MVGWRVVAAVWLGTTACGRVGFDPVAASDAGVQRIAPTCPTLAGAWTLEPPVLVPQLSSPTMDREPYLTADGLTAYVANLTTNMFRSYHATRVTTDASWGALTTTDWVNAQLSQATRVAITADGLEAFVAATNPSSDLWVASRSSTALARMIVMRPTNTLT